MNIKILYFNPLRECCYVIWDETGECAIIDPGAYDNNEFSRLVKLIGDQDLKPKFILLTHGHFDHVFGLAAARQQWNCPVAIHPKDIYQIETSVAFAHTVGLEIIPYTGTFKEITEKDEIRFGNTVLKVIHTPGHTEGGLCYYNESERRLFCGDTLFQGSVGRTDHPRGNYEKLLESIYLLGELPDDTEVYPGHGYPTTIGEERKHNPFFKENR